VSRQEVNGRSGLGLRAGTDPEPWQIRLFRKSIKKKRTLKAILDLLPPVDGKRCLEIGCATGLTSYFLRRRGGNWLSIDFESDHVASAKLLVGEGVQLMGEERIDLPAESVDVLVGINFLEHLQNDHQYFTEMARVLRPGGTFILTGPKGERGRPAYWLKRLYGFTSECGGFGHARDGYEPSALRTMLHEAGFRSIEIRTYSKFFTEVVEDTLNFFYYRLSTGRRNGGSSRVGWRQHRPAARDESRAEEAHGKPMAETTSDFHGNTAPMSKEAFQKVGKAFRAYSLIFPFLNALAVMDALLPGREAGYMFVCRATKMQRGEVGRQ